MEGNRERQKEKERVGSRKRQTKNRASVNETNKEKGK